MKIKLSSYIGFLFATLFISSLYAQKFDKKFSENFKVNKDVVLAINATNADINVTTWNRNEVAVDAVITVEGLSKKEAEKYLKEWKFEALGNKSKVQINANAKGFLHFGNYDFNFNFDMPEIEFEDFDFDIPEIEISEIKMPEIKIPEINLDIDEIMEDIDNADFDEDETRTLSYESNGKRKTVVIKSKKDWEKFKKSPEYKVMKEDISKKIKKAQVEIKKIDTKKIEEQIKKAKLEIKKIDKEKIKLSIAKAKENMEKMKLKMAKMHKDGNNVFIIEDGKSKKKVTITRKINVKVPKDAKFDLHTRHSKVKLPKGKTSGKVSYGTFNADEINGGKLNIYYAPVNVKLMSGSTVTLNNITDATIASVINTKLFSNSTSLKIENVANNVDLTSKMGDLLITKVADNVQDFDLKLNYTDATINFGNLSKNFAYYFKDNTASKTNLNGNFTITTKNNSVKINSKLSKLIIKK